MDNKIIVLSQEAYEKINNKLDAILSKDTQTNSQLWLRTEDVLSLLDISKSTLQTYRDKLIVPFYQVGRKILYKQSDIDAYMEKHRIISPVKTKANAETKK